MIKMVKQSRAFKKLKNNTTVFYKTGKDKWHLEVDLTDPETVLMIRKLLTED